MKTMKRLRLTISIIFLRNHIFERFPLLITLPRTFNWSCWWRCIIRLLIIDFFLQFVHASALQSHTHKKSWDPGILQNPILEIPGLKILDPAGACPSEMSLSPPDYGASMQSQLQCTVIPWHLNRSPLFKYIKAYMPYWPGIYHCCSVRTQYTAP